MAKSKKLTSKELLAIRNKIQIEADLNDIRCPNCKERLVKSSIYYRSEGAMDYSVKLNKKGDVVTYGENFQSYDGSDASGLYCLFCNEQFLRNFVTDFSWGDDPATIESHERLKFILRRNK